MTFENDFLFLVYYKKEKCFTKLDFAKVLALKPWSWFMWHSNKPKISSLNHRKVNGNIVSLPPHCNCFCLYHFCRKTTHTAYLPFFAKITE